MFATILIGRYLSVQGKVLKRLPGGLVEIRIGSRTMIGRPVPRAMPQTAGDLTREEATGHVA